MVTMRRRYYYPQKQYLVLKAEGLEFIETWFGTPKCVPPSLTRLYQLLLHMVTMNGTVPVYLALISGYTSKLIGEAISKGFVELSLVPRRPSEEVLQSIREIIGKPPREMFV